MYCLLKRDPDAEGATVMSASKMRLTGAKKMTFTNLRKFTDFIC